MYHSDNTGKSKNIKLEHSKGFNNAAEYINYIKSWKPEVEPRNQHTKQHDIESTNLLTTSRLSRKQKSISKKTLYNLIKEYYLNISA